MKLNIEFVKRNLISIIVAGSILTVGGVSIASTLLSDPSETAIEPSTTIEATFEPTATIAPTLEPTLEPTASPIVTPEPTQAVITLDGVTINAINSVINAKDSVVNNPKGTIATTTQAPNPPIIQPVPVPVPMPVPVPYDNMIPYFENGVVYISYQELHWRYNGHGYDVVEFLDNDEYFIRILLHKDQTIVLDIPTVKINESPLGWYITYDYYLQNIKPFLNRSN